MAEIRIVPSREGRQSPDYFVYGQQGNGAAAQSFFLTEFASLGDAIKDVTEREGEAYPVFVLVSRDTPRNPAGSKVNLTIQDVVHGEITDPQQVYRR